MLFFLLAFVLTSGDFLLFGSPVETFYAIIRSERLPNLSRGSSGGMGGGDKNPVARFFSCIYNFFSLQVVLFSNETPSPGGALKSANTGKPHF